MNELLEQFLLESRELVEQASRSLLVLEARPDDRESLDNAFRAFHTLKGGAGIVDFAAMARALHAAEDTLAAIRAGTAPVTSEVIGNCLACLDQVVAWLSSMQTDGHPPAEAEAEAEAIRQRFGRAAPRGISATLAGPMASMDSWVEELLARHPEAAQAARTALRYSPDPECFFRGEDPLALMATLPSMVALELAPAGEWPALDALDPFACHLVLLALISGTAEKAASLFSQQRAQCDIVPLPGAAGGPPPGLGPAARSLLEAQLLLLADGGSAAAAPGSAGRLASAGRVAANVLRHGSRATDVGLLEQALARSQAAGDPHPLAAAIGCALDGSLATASNDARPAPHRVQESALHTLRVDLERVEALMKLTSELTVAKNALGHVVGQARDGADPKRLAAVLKDQHAVLERLVGELQRSVLSIRILPLRHVFQRFPRLVREMSLSLGKPARLVTEGDATEADKAIVEALSDPLLHVLRNAVDHGVETAPERAALGKPAMATIQLRAAREGDQVSIEVEDDGRGIDAAGLRQVAAERRLAPAETLAAMPDEAVIDLIFAPGFSTASEVTGLSGRGVGMDAVRTAVGRLGGRVSVRTCPGQGTVIRFSLPFTLMMTQVMTVETAGQAFGIPLDAVAETVRVARGGIRPVGGARAFVLRQRTIPLIPLGQALGKTSDGATGGDATVVVASFAGEMIGFEVDRVGEQMDVMLKPLDGLLAGLRGIAGTALMGDGRVLIVLDLQDLLQ
jgi:two-component system chemotaxis sensor kinase CheA